MIAYGRVDAVLFAPPRGWRRCASARKALARLVLAVGLVLLSGRRTSCP